MSAADVVDDVDVDVLIAYSSNDNEARCECLQFDTT